MYKVNDKVYLYIRGAKKESFVLNGLHRSRFGTIKDIRNENDRITYVIKLDTTDKDVLLVEDCGAFTFYDMNELLDTIRSMDVPLEVKEKYTELINNILQGKEIENKQYKF